MMPFKRQFHKLKLSSFGICHTPAPLPLPSIELPLYTIDRIGDVNGGPDIHVYSEYKRRV